MIKVNVLHDIRTVFTTFFHSFADTYKQTVWEKRQNRKSKNFKRLSTKPTKHTKENRSVGKGCQQVLLVLFLVNLFFPP